MTTTVPKHAGITRLIHTGLAIAIVSQLATSQFMNPDDGGDRIFSVHQYVGLAAFCLVLVFWIYTMVRCQGTTLSDLLPWFSGAGRTAVWADIKRHVAALRRFNLPAHADNSALASAIHGLGLLLMLAMAASGTLYYFVNVGDPDGPGLVKVAMTVHQNLGNLVWAYLIGHAGFAVLNHFGHTMSLRTMWSVKGTNK